MQPKQWMSAGVVMVSMSCGAPEEGDGGASVEVADSLGVTIVTNHTAELPSGSWRLGDLTTSIGAVEGDSTQILGSPSGARRLQNGHYAVADEMTNEIRVYDASGEHVVTRGRSGQGPGEFQMLRFLLPYRGDSVMVVEIAGRRISVLGPDLAFGRVLLSRPSFNYRLEGFRPEQSCCRVVGAMEGAFVVEYPGMIPNTGLGVQRSTVTIARLAEDGTFQDTLGVFDSAEYHPGGVRPGVPNRRATLSSGVVSVAADSTLYVTDGRTLEVRAIGPEGTVRWISRIARAPEPLTDEVKARYRASAEATLDEQAERYPQAAAETEFARRMLEETPFAATLPAINTMLVDRVGNLWVTAVRSWWWDTGSETWEVFDPTGRWVTTVEIPSELRVFEIGEDYVIGLFRDELEVPFVRVYELVKS